MKAKILVALIAMALVVTVVGCKQKETAPIGGGAGGGSSQLPAGHPAGEGGGMPAFTVPVTETVIPDTVKGKWASVVMTIEDKEKGSTQDVTINLNAEHKVGNLTIKIGDFIPDFRMEGQTITSMSNELNNPAVHVTVMEGTEEIFKGWLYSKFPAIHPFQHDKVGITLKEANAAK